MTAQGESALNYAIQMQRKDLVELLLSNVSPNKILYCFNHCKRVLL